MKKNNFAEFVAKKEFKKFAEKNQTLINDIQNLVHEMIMFEVKYGIHILYEFDKIPPKKGRGLGVKDFVDITKAK